MMRMVAKLMPMGAITGDRACAHLPAMQTNRSLAMVWHLPVLSSSFYFVHLLAFLFFLVVSSRVFTRFNTIIVAMVVVVDPPACSSACSA